MIVKLIEDIIGIIMAAVSAAKDHKLTLAEWDDLKTKIVLLLTDAKDAAPAPYGFVIVAVRDLFLVVSALLIAFNVFPTA